MSVYLILTAVSIVSAVFVIAIKSCFASKCENFSVCWGLINIHREVALENSELQNERTTVSDIIIQRKRTNPRTTIQTNNDPHTNIPDIELVASEQI
jgi:hypothetical protein